MIGEVIKNNYRIIDEVGQGSVAAVYLAKDLAENRVVALKIIYPELAKEQDFARRFRREARPLTELDSLHAVKVLDYGSDEGLDFVVLEYVEAQNLRAILDEGGPLGVERALDVARQVAQCLANAHEKGIVHRDIRPANLMLTADGTVKVMDFGIAQGVDLDQLTATGVLGSPHYLSPEQVEGKADIRSDIYSLGVTLYEMLAGERPYEGESAAEVVLKHLQEPVPSLRELDEGIPTEVDELVRTCLAKEPGERYQTPLQLLAGIGGVMRAIGLEEKPGIGIEDALAGQTLGQYRLIEKIGRGGMATVYKAYEPSLDRYVAVKVLAGYVALDPDFAARFEREAKAIAKLDHPNILPVYDYGREGDITYIAMKYVEAGTLKERLGQSLPLDTTVDILSQVAGALDHAHKQGVIHRDVKPSNVLMSEEGWALLGDFGLAKMVGASVQLTGSGVGVGTPAYMSPEQGQGIVVDARSDVYSLGVMLYEMLTGQVPYEAETPMAVVLKHITAPPPLPREANLAISEAVERVVLKAMAKDPADRYQSAGKLTEALKKAAAGVVEEAVPVVVPEVREAEMKPVAVLEEEVIPLWQRVPLWGWGAVGGVVLLAVVGGVLLAGGGPGATPTPAAVAGRATTPAAAVSPTVTPVTLTAYPTYTPFPTYTPVPTDTPLPPTATDTSEPTPTSTPPPPTPTHTPLPPTPTPSPTPYGGRIAFTSYRDDNTDIYVMNADGSGQTRLTNHPAGDGAPSWSPDGRRIAFASERDDPAPKDCDPDMVGPECDMEIYVMNADGSGQTNLTNNPTYDGQPSWSPDGTRIAFVSYRDITAVKGFILHGEIHVMNADGSGQTRLTNELAVYTSPSWSPDGRHIAFKSHRHRNDEIYVMNADGSGQTNLTNHPARDLWPSWSPDGTRIAFASERDGNWDIYVMNADDSEVTCLTNHPARDLWPSWSPDGRRIAFASDRDGDWEIYVMNADGGGQTNLTSNPADDWEPSWGP